ncbi:MAG: hypothetical protein WCR98_00020 [Saccharofermentanales bacterium]
MTPEQRLNRITSILSVGVIRLVNEKMKQERVRAQVEMLTLCDQASSRSSSVQIVTPGLAPGTTGCSTA